MDTDWDVSELDPKLYKTLFSVLGALAGVKDVGLNPDGLRIIHTPEALPSIRQAFAANNLRLRLIEDETKDESLIRIPEMDCPVEEAQIRGKLKEIAGVSGLRFDLEKRVLTVRYKPGDLEQVLGAVRSLGFTPEVLNPADGKKVGEFKPAPIAWGRYGAALLLAIGAEAADFMAVPDWISMVLAFAAIALAGVNTYKTGFIALKNLNFNMNALMAVAVTGAFLIGSWPEAAMVMVLFEISEAIEQLSLDRARNAVRSLLKLTPETALVQNAEGAFTEEKVENIAVGDRIRILPGNRLPVDGVVESGRSSVNQSTLTGESLPVDKAAGDTVFAGSINENGTFDYRATATSSDSLPAKIIAAIESAQSARAPTQRFVDAFARYYTPCVFAVAIATALIPPLFFGGDWLGWIYKALTLLVIACPCALVISTPVTIVSGLASAAKRGILIKGGLYLEKARRLQTIALDKTGTITEGKPRIIARLDGGALEEVAPEALLLARRNEHPVSRALRDFAHEKGFEETALELASFEQIAGKGVVGTVGEREYYLGNMQGLDRYYLQNDAVRAMAKQAAQLGASPLFFANSSGVIAAWAVADRIKEGSKEAIADLKSLGIKTVMLTGDNAATARRIGEEVKVDNVRFELLPSDKQNLVAKMTQREVSAMVGDGINDAPALARADIGIAMGAMGADAALEVADVALMNDDLKKIPEFIRLSKATYSILVQNITIALVIKAVFFVLTYMGLTNMWMAVFADTGCCLIVVLNGLRMLSWKPGK
jgi:Cd2+/Zn2+-exporting ATPase